jgi:hypothetical protein
MFRFPRFLILFLTLSLLFAACRPPTADRRPQADGGPLTVVGGQTSTPTPTFAPTLTATPTPTEIPQPSLESLGLSAETQALLKRQGWDIAWDAQNARYLIRQRAWDEASQSFTPQLTHEAGWIDLEGNLHFTATQYSAAENPDGTWKDTSTQSEVVIDLKNLPKNPDLIIKQQLDENGNPISFQEQLKTPGFHLLETKNPAFEKTGILTLTYLDENGIPKTVTFNRNLEHAIPITLSSFSETDETFQGTPTFLPWEAIHSNAPLHVQLAIINGYDRPFPPKSEGSVISPVDTLDGYTLLFFGFPNRQTPIPAFAMFSYRPSLDNSGNLLFPPDSAPIRLAKNNAGKIPCYITFDKKGNPLLSIITQFYNPSEMADKTKRKPDETLLISAAVANLKENPEMLKNLPAYIRHIKETGLFIKIVLATQGDFFKWFTSPEADAYFNTIKPTNNPANPNFGPYQVKIWRELMKAFFGPDLSKTGLASLDSLLGMEGNDVKTQLWEQSNGAYANISGNLGYLEQLSKTNTLIEVPMPGEMLPPDFQKLVLVISP